VIGQSLSGVFSRKHADHEEALEELEEALLGADLSPRLVMKLIEELEEDAQLAPIEKKAHLRRALLNALPPVPDLPSTPEGPLVVLVVGVNGSGKTTTTAKLAHWFQKKGQRSLLAAADTFRAAGSDQLVLWADRLGCEVVSGKTGSDAASVAFDAVKAAEARGADVVLIDTAGRMHTKKPLMLELEKIQRTLGKAMIGAPHATWIVLDASLGQNAVAQARFFHDIVPLTGVIVTKLDGSSKAGFLFSVYQELQVPVYFAGLGEGEDDLEIFDPESFVDALLAVEVEGASA
jgi:fused signal recognition particle receptor